MAIKAGAVVRQVVVPIQGVVTKKQFNESHDKMEYVVEWPAGPGESPHSRAFLEGEIELVPDQPKGEAA